MRAAVLARPDHLVETIEHRLALIERRLVELEQRRTAVRPRDAALLELLHEPTGGLTFSSASALRALQRVDRVPALVDSAKQLGKIFQRIAAQTPGDGLALVRVGRSCDGALWQIVRVCK